MTTAIPAPRLFGLILDANLRDHLLVTLWLFVTFKQFRGDELLLYPLALYFVWAFVRDFPSLLDLIARSWILWPVPIWALLSLSWGAETAQIFKYGLQLLLTVMICYCIALHLTGRQILLSLLFVAGFYGVLSVVTDANGGVAARGVFYSKNAMGGAMVLLWITALCTILDGGMRYAFRLAAVPAALLSLWLIEVSNSATAVLLAAGGLAVILTMWAVMTLSMQAILSTIAFALAAIIFVAAWGALTLTEFDPISPVLKAFGKDSTLTGRTVLWNYAADEIARDPWLGKGEGGFWTPRDGLSTAHRIFVEFYKAPSSTFSFHNAYYEMAVRLGLIGMAFMIASTAWCFLRIGFATLKTRGMPEIFFFCIAVVTLVRSFAESGHMEPFSLLSMLLVVGALKSLLVALPQKRPWPDRSVTQTPVRQI